MERQSQSKAVYNATVNVLSENGIKFTDYETDLKEVITGDMKKQIVSIVMEGFKNGTVDLKDTESNRKKLESESELRKYTNGLVNNWHRKSPVYNLGNPHTVANPGSRAGSGDPQVKALRALAKKFANDEEKLAGINVALETRLEELRAEKQAKIEINVDDLPEELRHLV